MRRAFVISLFAHLLAFSLLIEVAGVRPDMKGGGTGQSSVNVRIQPLMPLPADGPRTPALVKPVSDGRLAAPKVTEKPANLTPRSSRSSVPVSTKVLPEAQAEAEKVQGLPEDAEREYRIGLARAMRKYTNNLEGQSRPAIEGMVMLEVSRRVGAALPSLSLVKSSGSRELDARARDAVAAALAEVALPMVARDVSFRMSFVVEYR